MCATLGIRPVMPIPSFSMYELLAKRYDVDFIPTYYSDAGHTFAFPLQETIDALASGQPGMLIISQPNNPLGSRLSTEDLHALMQAAQSGQAIVVIDEAYAEFDPAPEAQSGDNVIILRTLSKSFGLAGLRVGYSIASPEWSRRLSGLTLPWGVSGLSASFALSAIERADRFAQRRQLLIEERERFYEALTQIPGIHAYESQANFMLCRVQSASEVVAKLKARGILVGLGESKALDPRAQALLKDTLRMSVPSPADRDIVIAALREAVGAI